jgi:hypothetical protein
MYQLPSKEQWKKCGKWIGGNLIQFRNQVALILFLVLILVFFWHAGTRYDSLIRLISAIAWPLAILTIIWCFGGNVGNLIDRLISLKFPGGEATFGRQIGKEAAEQLQETQRDIRKPMEYKILNTLFTKQVNKWPNLDVFFVLIIGAGSEYSDYLQAKGKLLGEKLIAEIDDANRGILLTVEGFKYCKAHYAEFPPAQWWDEEQINQENLTKVLRGDLGPKS